MRPLQDFLPAPQKEETDLANGAFGLFKNGDSTYLIVANSQELHSEPRVGSPRWTRRGKEHPAADVPLLFSCVAARDSFGGGGRKEGTFPFFAAVASASGGREREREGGEKRKFTVVAGETNAGPYPK